MFDGTEEGQPSGIWDEKGYFVDIPGEEVEEPRAELILFRKGQVDGYLAQELAKVSLKRKLEEAGEVQESGSSPKKRKEHVEGDTLHPKETGGKKKGVKGKLVMGSW